MGKTYLRIDDRLIHGQIVTAWCGTLNIREIIAIDDSLAGNPMLKSIMTMGVPSQYNPHIVNAEEARQLLSKEVLHNRLVITRFARNIRELSDFLPVIEHINLGNCSKQENAAYTLSSGAGRYLSLTEEDMQALLHAEKNGCEIFCQLLPSEKLHTWAQLKSSI